MTHPPVDPDDDPVGGSLSPTPHEDPDDHADEPQAPPVYPPPPPPAAGYQPPPGGALPSSQVPDAFPAPPPPGLYPPPTGGSFPPAPDYPPTFPPPGYGGGYAGAAMARPHRATVVLVLGVLGLLCCAPLAFVAFFMGRSDLAAMDAGVMDSSGRSLTNIGRILGIVGMVLLVFQVVYVWLNFDTLGI